MKIEYSYYDISSNETEIKNSIISSLKFPIQSISVLPSYTKFIHSIIPSDVHLSCPIDYPLGILDTKSRMFSIELAIKNGANIIDILCQSHILCNRKYEKLREDIRLIKEICSAHKDVKLRYILEYRVYSYELLYKVAQILLDLGIDTILPSTGYGLDDINDNILASALINKKVPNINIVCNGNVWNYTQIQTIQKANLYGIRVNSLNALQLLTNGQIK